MNTKLIVGGCAAGAGLVYLAATSLGGNPTAAQPQPTGSAVAVQVPTAAARATASGGPVLDSDVGPEQPRPSERPSMWASVKVTPPAKPTVAVSSSGRPRGADEIPDKVDTRNVDKVAEAFVATAFTMDTKTDSSPQAGFARAAKWATDAYRPYLVAAPQANPGADWWELRDNDGWTSVTVEKTTVATQPSDSPAATIRSFKVTITTHRTSSTQEHRYVYATLARQQDGTWKVASFTDLGS